MSSPPTLCQVLIDTATGWVARLQEAHSRGKLAAKLTRLQFFSMLICDEVSCIPFDHGTANIFFHLVASCREYAPLSLMNDLPFGGDAKCLATRPSRPR